MYAHREVCGIPEDGRLHISLPSLFTMLKSRSVKMVEKMLESFRRKVEVQVKEKTNQVLDNVLQDLKSEVDSFNSQVQQDL